MSEVEKLYSLAVVEKKEYGYCSWDCDCPYTNCEDIHCDSSCPYWKVEKVDYPPFTAEEQIELIKWLSQHTYRNYIKFRFDICGLWYCECNMSNSDMHHTFEESLAELVNNLWQDLTDAEKAQIKEILE